MSLSAVKNAFSTYLNLKLIGLFIAVLLVSVVWHFPASWVFAQAEVKKNLPPNMAITQVSGTWWKGDVSLSRYQKSVGHVAWQWQPSAMLVGEIGVLFKWTLHEQFLTLNARSDGQQVTLNNLQANITLDQIGKFDESLAVLDGAKGDLIAKNINLVFPLDNVNPPWPSVLTGQIAIPNVDLMGVQARLIELKPVLAGDQLTLNVSGGGKGWKLSGQTRISKPNRFKHNITLKAQTRNNMPDWVTLFMRKNSQTKASLTTSGQF